MAHKNKNTEHDRPGAPERIKVLPSGVITRGDQKSVIAQEGVITLYWCDNQVGVIAL